MKVDTFRSIHTRRDSVFPSCRLLSMGIGEVIITIGRGTGSVSSGFIGRCITSGRRVLRLVRARHLVTLSGWIGHMVGRRASGLYASEVLRLGRRSTQWRHSPSTPRRRASLRVMYAMVMITVGLLTTQPARPTTRPRMM